MKTFEQFRQKRLTIYNELFSARSLCMAGLLIMPSLLFIPDTIFRTGLFLFFWLLCWLCGKKNNPLMTILVILGIVIFNLIIPYGQVLFSIGVFKITLGALTIGIQRAVTLEGLIMLSRISIRQDLRIPGSFGALLGESFMYLNSITELKKRITAKNFMEDIDKLMMELSETSSEDTVVKETPLQKTKPIGFAILAVIVILSWLPWVFI